MNIKNRIERVCQEIYRSGNGVLPPTICPYCFGCPIATLVVSLSGNSSQLVTEAIPVPEEHIAEVTKWIEKLEIKYLKGGLNG